VDEWCRDLHVWCEPECMTYLQSKPIISAQPQQQSAFASAPQTPQRSSVDLAIDTNKMMDVIRKIQRGSRAVNVSFNDMNK
jgi:hypothetical protein